MDSSVVSVMGAPAQRIRTYPTLRVPTLVRWITGVYLFSIVLDAPIRYGLSLVNMFPLIYIPKALLLLMVPVLLILTRRASKALFGGALILSFYIAWGMVNLRSVWQPLFVLWVFTPLVYALLIGKYFISELARYRRLFLWLFAITALGVLMSPLIHFPWVGQNIHLGGHSLEVSRQWGTFGFERYAGFSRASYSAATQLLIFAILIVTTQRNHFYAIPIWIVAGLAIFLTTTKGIFGAYFMITIFFLSGLAFHQNKPWRYMWALLLWLSAILMVTIPISSIFIEYDPSFHSFASKVLFASFGDRLNWMWPDSLRMLNDWPSWMFGLGLGGIGAPQQFFYPTAFLPADNLFVYLCVDFGLLISITLIVGRALE